MKSEIRNPKSEISALSRFGGGALGLRPSGFVRISDFGFRIFILLALLFTPHAVQACSVCFGSGDSKLSQGMLAGVLVLLFVVLSVLGGFVALFIFLARKAAAAAALENASPESKA